MGAGTGPLARVGQRPAGGGRPSWAVAGRLAVLAAVLACSAALGLAAPVPALAQEGRTVVEIRFEGTGRAEEPLLRERIHTRVGQPLDLDKLDEDVRRLATQGEFETDVRAEVREEADGVHVIFFLHEQQIVRRVVVDGTSELSNSDVLAVVGTQAGSYVSAYRLAADREAIRRLYQESGYFLAEVTTRVIPHEGAEGGVDVWHDVAEGPWVFVGELSFVGNATFSTSRLLDFTTTRERTGPLGVIHSGELKMDQLDEDLRRVETYYRSQGYLDARVFLDDLSFDSTGQARIRVRVLEGPLYGVHSLTIEGVELFTVEAIRAAMHTREGEPLRMDHLDTDREAILRMYGEQGYIFANVEVAIGYRPYETSVDLVLTVTEGQRVYVERIEIRGNYRTRDDVIRRELSLYPGDPFNSELLTESRERLGRRGYFSNLTIDFEDGTAPNRKTLILNVEEQRTGNILFGAGISSDLGFFGRIQVTQRNFDIADLPESFEDFLNGTAFVGGGQILNIRLEPGGDRSLYSIRFTEPYLLGHPYSLSTDFFWLQRNWTDYTEGRLGGRISLGRELARDLVARLEYNIRDVTIFEIDQDALADVVEVAGPHLLSGGLLGIDIDKNALAPNRLAYEGWGASASYEVLGGPFGGDVDLQRIQLDLNAQLTLFRFPPPDPFMDDAMAAAGAAHVVQFRFEAGWQEAYGRTDEVPIFERFFAGGPRSIRGFQFRSVGPQEDDDPTGGEYTFFGTLEANIPVPTIGEFLRGVAFIDFGNVTRHFDELFDPDLIRVSAGVGIRLYVPQVFPAPIALDFGFPLREVPGDDRETFSFSIDAGF